MLKCHECHSERVSIWGDLWVDFYENGHREVEKALEEFEPKYGGSVLCRECGFNWTYGHR
jgi:hypothetical protein